MNVAFLRFQKILLFSRQIARERRETSLVFFLCVSYLRFQIRERERERERILSGVLLIVAHRRQ